MGEKGFTLFELVIAMLLLAIISVMVYSVLSVGIKYSDSGEKRVHALEREWNFLALLHRQIKCALYDMKQRKVIISADSDILRMVTRSPLIWPRAGIVLAYYRFNAEEHAVYYLEKRDYYNTDYDEEYVPNFQDMIKLSSDIDALAFSYDPDVDQSVSVEYRDRHYEFMPGSLPEEATISGEHGK